MRNQTTLPQSEHALLPPPPAAADQLDRLAIPLASLPRVGPEGPEVACQRALGELLAALPPDSRRALEHLAHVGQALPLRLLGNTVAHLAPLEQAGLVRRESTPSGLVAVLPLEVRFALAARGLGGHHQCAGTLIGHLERMSEPALARAQEAWGLPVDSGPAGRAALYRTVLRDWRSALRELPEKERQLFSEALSARPVSLEGAGSLFPEVEASPAGRALLARCLLIPLHPGSAPRQARVPLELLAVATRVRRQKRFRREQARLEPLRRAWPEGEGTQVPFDTLLVQLLLTFKDGLPHEQPDKLPQRELGVEPARGALMLFFARDNGFYTEGGLDVARCLEYFDLPPYERIGQRARYAVGLRRWNELAARPWAEVPCPAPGLRIQLVEQLLRFTPDGVLEEELERLLGEDLPPNRLYRRPAAAVARYLEMWGLVETARSPAGMLVRLSPEYAAHQTLNPPYPVGEGRVQGWLTVGGDGSFRARLDAPFDDLLRLHAATTAPHLSEGVLLGRLDRQGLLRALSGGHDATQLVDTVRRGAEGRLPRRIEILLHEATAREGAVEILTVGGVVTFRDPLDLALARQGELGSLLGLEVAPGVVLVPASADLGRVRKLLADKGLHAVIRG